MPPDINTVDSDTTSVTTCSVPSQEETYAAPSRWRRSRQWCKRLARSCTRRDINTDMTSSKTSQSSTSTRNIQNTFCWKGRLRTLFPERLGIRRRKTRERFRDDTSSAASEVHSFDQLATSEPDLDFEMLTASSECESPITPSQLCTPSWEMAEVMDAVDAGEADSSTPKKQVAQAPQLDTLAEVDEEEYDGDDENSYPVISFKKRDRLLSVVYEEGEYDADESNELEPGDLDDTLDNIGNTAQPEQEEEDGSETESGYESEYIGSDYDDHIPPELEAVLQQISPSKQPWIRKRCRSAPALQPPTQGLQCRKRCRSAPGILCTKTFVTPPSTPTRTVSQASSDWSSPATRSDDWMMNTPPQSSFEAARRFWVERCEADNSFGSIGSNSSLPSVF